MKIQKCLITLVALVFCFITACSSNVGMEKKAVTPETKLEMKTIPADIKFGETSTQATKLQPYKIQPGDELDIKFFYNPELNEVVTVRPDGMISLQLVDEIRVVSLEPAELDQILTKKYSKELRKPVLTVIVRTFSGQRVFVGGEVIRPGLLTLAPGMDPVQAVMQAGGLRETASPESTIVIRKGEDNRPVPIRFNLSNYIKGKSEIAEFQLQPDDVVFVPKSSIAQLNKFVDEVIRGVLMFNGWSFGFAYRVDNKE
jgi:protein involved in polysaccharide export with SLBB domain